MAWGFLHHHELSTVPPVLGNYPSNTQILSFSNYLSCPANDFDLQSLSHHLRPGLVLSFIIFLISIPANALPFGYLTYRLNIQLINSFYILRRNILSTIFFLLLLYSFNFYLMLPTRNFFTFTLFFSFVFRTIGCLPFSRVYFTLCSCRNTHCCILCLSLLLFSTILFVHLKSSAYCRYKIL